MARRKKGAKPKAVSYELIERASIIGQPMYALLSDLVRDHHRDDLSDATIALAWNLSWKPDVDGRVTLGKCKRASDLDRELAPFDLVILLRRAFWTDPRFSELQRRALLDHELCHAVLKRDANGEPLVDERGRRVYRLQKHDIEEFAVIVQRYGIWTNGLEAFAEALNRGRARHGDYWIGVGALQQRLHRVGLIVPADTVQAWNQTERADADAWARACAEMGQLPQAGVGITPSHLLAFLTPELPLVEPGQ